MALAVASRCPFFSFASYYADPPQLDDHFMSTYRPLIRQAWNGKQIVSPSTPYAAAVRRSEIMFLDQRFDPESAQHIKEQLEQIVSPTGTSYLFVDEIDVTAQWMEHGNDEPLFVFDPAYARLFFAAVFNQVNPSLKLPVHPPPGEAEGLRAFDMEKLEIVSDLTHKAEYMQCHLSGAGTAAKVLRAAKDSPRWEGESDTEYYQRMDMLHWGPKEDAGKEDHADVQGVDEIS